MSSDFFVSYVEVTLYMQYVIPPIKKIFDPNKIPLPINTEDNFYEVHTTKCTKTLCQADTIRPVVNRIFAPLSDALLPSTCSKNYIQGKTGTARDKIGTAKGKKRYS